MTQSEQLVSRVIVVLPAYNEEANIGRLLDRIDLALREEKFPYGVVVVDDGSKDRTLSILQDYESRVPLTIHRHIQNQGLGPTIRDGLLVAARMAGPHDVIVSMDADETHNPGLIFRMVHMIREGHDVVIASRYRDGSRIHGLAAYREFISIGASWLFRVVFPTRGVRDYTCGFRAYRAATLQAAVSKHGERLVTAAGFQCMVDILLKLRDMNVIFGEVPMILRYDLKEGQSKMKVVRTIFNTLALLVNRRFGGREAD